MNTFTPTQHDLTSDPLGRMETQGLMNLSVSCHPHFSGGLAMRLKNDKEQSLSAVEQQRYSKPQAVGM